MRYLLDTHVLLWILNEEKKVENLKDMFTEPKAEVFYSAISIWEIAIKYAKGKLNISPSRALEGARLQRFDELPLKAAHTVSLESMEMNGSKDPFDNILIAQAKEEGLFFYTADKKILALNESFIKAV